MHRLRGRCLVHGLAWLAGVVIALAPFAEAALAQSGSSSEKYQQLVDRGLAAYADQRPADARSLFAQAHALQPGARTLRALGIADLALDNYTLAKDELEAALAEQVLALSENQRNEVHGLLKWMQTNLGTLHLSITPLTADTKIDGRPIAASEVLLAPEEHRLTIAARGFVSQERTFTVAMDRPMKLEISLERASAPVLSMADEHTAPRAEPEPASLPAPPSSRPLAAAGGFELWPWLGGAGAVLLVTGGTMFAFGMSDKATVEHVRSPVRLSEIEAAHDRVPWITGIGLSLGIAGIAGIGAAAVLLLTQPEPRNDVAWSLQAGPTQLSLTGRF
jgi:hypothetical protein